MRVINRFANAYRRVSQSRICTTVYSLAQRSQWGWAGRLRTASAKGIGRVFRITRLPKQILLRVPSELGAEELHQFLLVAAGLQFVEERDELLVIEFYPC